MGKYVHMARLQLMELVIVELVIIVSRVLNRFVYNLIRELGIREEQAQAIVWIATQVNIVTCWKTEMEVKMIVRRPISMLGVVLSAF